MAIEPTVLCVHLTKRGTQYHKFLRQLIKPVKCPAVHPCGVNILKNLKLWDCWADVNETWYVYSMGNGKNFWNFEYCPHTTRDYPKLTLVTPYTALQLQRCS